MTSTGDDSVQPSRGELPPGRQLYAEVALPERTDRTHQLRIVGDDRRGYLLAGLSPLANSESAEFWFPTLSEAKRAAIPFGVDEGAWKRLESLGQVRTS